MAFCLWLLLIQELTVPWPLYKRKKIGGWKWYVYQPYVCMKRKINLSRSPFVFHMLFCSQLVCIRMTWPGACLLHMYRRRKGDWLKNLFDAFSVEKNWYFTVYLELVRKNPGFFQSCLQKLLHTRVLCWITTLSLKNIIRIGQSTGQSPYFLGLLRMNEENTLKRWVTKIAAKLCLDAL